MKPSAKIGSVLALSVVLLTGSAVYADTATSTKNHNGVHNFLSRLHINGLGKSTIVGTVNATSTSGFTVNTQGGSWTVNTNADTHFTLASGLSNVKVGDHVMVYGNVSTTTQMTINATKVHDTSFKPTKMKGLKNSIKNHVNVGTVSSISGSNFVVTTKKNTPITVNTTASTTFYSRDRNAINISSLKINDKVQVFGKRTSTTTVQASLVHDLSL